MTITLRPYQQQAIQSVINDWQSGLTDVLVTMATGLGKTAVFLSLVNQVLQPGNGKRGLIIAHRKELIDQPLARLLAYYPDEWAGRAGVVMADEDEPHRQLTVATIQTLASSPKRLQKILAYGKIDYLIVDECFPAGTLVDGRPIETLKVGDMVWSYRNGAMRPKRITQVFRNPAPSTLIRITTQKGQLTCTPNHPVLVMGIGWVAAAHLRKNDLLLFGGYDADHIDVHPVREGISAQEPGSDLQLSAERNCVLHSRMPAKAYLADDGGNQPEVCQLAHESQQPDEQVRIVGEDALQAQGAFEERVSWRPAGQRHIDRAADGAGQGAALGGGDSYSNRLWTAERAGIPDGLQGGHRELELEDRHRSGWEQPQAAGQEGRGCQESPVIGVARVDRVEVLERGSDGEFERLCPGGFVYNLEVEHYHTYTANGIVVHNCHHFTDKNTYQKVLDVLKDANPALRHLGVTATPVRADGDGLAGVYQKESFHHGIVEGIRSGYLAPVRWLAIQTRISVASVKTVAGDFQQKGLANVFETDNCFDLVVETHRKFADGRQAAAFVVSVEGAYKLAEKFNQAGIPAAAADGTTDRATRARILKDFAEGRTQVLCNVALWTEGLDVPQISCIHQVRPTKSDGLYTQIIGRALRTYPGKNDALVLDYAPLGARNIAMMGDVLGVPLRKESYVQEKEQEGEAAGGFTFDGKFRYLEGNPAEIISRQLDYLDLSPWSWWRAEDGWMSLGLGEASDHVERILLMSPVDDDGLMTLYGVARRVEHYESVDGADKKRSSSWHARVIVRGQFAEVSERAETACNQYGNAGLAQKAKGWRSQPPSDAQIAFARRLKGAWKPGLTRGQLAQSITHAQGMAEVRWLADMPKNAPVRPQEALHGEHL